MPILKLPSGELRDEIRQPLYDSIFLSAGENPVGQRQFFSSVQGKQLVDSNLKQNNILATATSFRVMGLGFDAQCYEPLNQKVLPVIMQQSSLRLKIGEKDYWESIALFVAGRLHSNHALYGQTAATERVHQRFGDQAVQALVLTGKHTVDINPLQSFFVDWQVQGLTAQEIVDATPAASTRVKFVTSLKGLLRRPVQ
jgi:hypothetical protein